MKKLFFVAVMALISLTASAQLITSNRTVRGARAHNTWIDLGVGAYTNEGAKGADLNLGIRFNKMFSEYVGWDIIKIGARSNTKDIGKYICAEALTGIRGESPVLFSNAKAYANFGLGYLYGFDAEKGGFAWEIGAGLKLTPRFNIGIAYNSYKLGKGDATGIFGLRLGFAL